MQMEPPNVGLQLQIRKLLHQLPGQRDQNREKEYSTLRLLLLTSRTITKMLKLAKQKSTEKEYSIKTSGKFVFSELHDTQNASNDFMCTEAKTKTRFDECTRHDQLQVCTRIQR
jgi:hypothetical protein